MLNKTLLCALTVFVTAALYAQPASNVNGTYYVSQGSSDFIKVEDWRSQDPPRIIIKDPYGNAEYLSKVSNGVWKDNGGMTARWKDDVSLHWGPPNSTGKLYFKEGSVPVNDHLGEFAESYYYHSYTVNGVKKSRVFQLVYENNKQTLILKEDDAVRERFTLGPNGYASTSHKLIKTSNREIKWDRPGQQKDYEMVLAEKDQIPTSTIQSTNPDPVTSTSSQSVTSSLAVNELDPSTKEAQIHKAAQERDFDEIEKLIQENADVNLKDGTKGRTALHYAALKNDTEIANLLIENDADLNKTDNTGKTALSIALEKSNYEMAKMLLKKNADASNAKAGLDRVLNTKEKEVLVMMLQNGANGVYAAEKAIQLDNIDMLNTVLDNSSARATNQLFEKAVGLRNQEAAVEVLVRGIDKDRAMDYVIKKRDKTMVEVVLGTNASVSSTNKALGFASSERDLSLARTAIEQYNADPTVGMAPAVSNGHLEMVNLLLSKGADPNDQLDEAAAAGKTQLVNAMLTQSANPDLGVKPAAENDKIETLQALLDAGGDANLAMPIAIEKQKIQMVNMCISASKPADVYRSEYIVKTCEKSNADILNALLLAGADPNPGMSVSIGKKDAPLVRELLQAGARVDRPEYLNKSAELKDAEVAQMLLEAGADPNTAMMISIEQKDAALVKLMLDHNADASPPQFIAKSSELGDAPVVDMLLEKGADAEQGMTPAVNNNHAEVVSHLINAGADGSKDMHMTASAKHNNAELTGLLITAGGKPELALKPAIDSNADKVVHLIGENGVEIGKVEYLVTCVEKNHTATAKEITAAGASAKDWWNESKGQNLLHRSIIMHLNANMVSVLVKAGADVNKKTKSGDSPLHLTVINSKKVADAAGNVIRVLINAGAEVNATNAQGETVLKIAPKKKAITKPLKDAGAKKKV